MGDNPATALLERGDIEVLGLLPHSSNYTFLARLEDEGESVFAVYKPARGERPLWDFPHGTLGVRELASYLVSRAGGWDLVPPTVMREEGPLGPGSLQTFVEHDPDRHFFVLMEERLEEFRELAALDIVINNADRKAGHVLEDAGGRLWAVDHGLTFHTEPKLRTVIWQFAGEPLGGAVRARLEVLGDALSGGGGLRDRLAGILSAGEADETLVRLETLLVEDRFPAPEGDRPLPWPLV